MPLVLAYVTIASFSSGTLQLAVEEMEVLTQMPATRFYIIIITPSLFVIVFVFINRENISNYRILNLPCLPDCVLVSFTLHPLGRP